MTELKGKRIGESWWKYRFDRGFAGLRRMDGGNYGYYFRDVDGTTIGKTEYYCWSKEDALRRISNIARHLRWTPLPPLPSSSPKRSSSSRASLRSRS